MRTWSVKEYNMVLFRTNENIFPTTTVTPWRQIGAALVFQTSFWGARRFSLSLIYDDRVSTAETSVSTRVPASHRQLTTASRATSYHTHHVYLFVRMCASISSLWFIQCHHVLVKSLCSHAVLIVGHPSKSYGEVYYIELFYPLLETEDYFDSNPLPVLQMGESCREWRSWYDDMATS